MYRILQRWSLRNVTFLLRFSLLRFEASLVIKADECALDLDLCSVARIILASPSVFHSLLTSTSIRLQTSSDSLLSLILNQFIERVSTPLSSHPSHQELTKRVIQLDNMSQGGQRKIVALAVAELVVTNNPIVLSRLPDLVALWSGVLAQTEETQEGE